MKKLTSAPTSLKLGIGPSTQALAKSTTELSKASSGGGLLERLKASGKETDASKLDAFKEAGKSEAIQRKYELDLKQAIAEMQKNFRLRLAVVLDFTASTSGDKESFIRETGQLISRLKPEFRAVDFISVAARGKYGGRGPEILMGEVNDLGFLTGVENIAYSSPTPIGEGVIQLSKGNFFNKSQSNDVDAIVGISDSTYEIFSGHDETMRQLKAAQVALASLTSYHPDSHVTALNILGELGIVVDRSRSEMNPMDLIIEFILNRKMNLLRTQAAQKVRAKMANTTSVPLSMPISVSLGEHLRLKGHVREAFNVIQGGKRSVGELKQG